MKKPKIYAVALGFGFAENGSMAHICLVNQTESFSNSFLALRDLANKLYVAFIQEYQERLNFQNKDYYYPCCRQFIQQHALTLDTEN